MATIKIPNNNNPRVDCTTVPIVHCSDYTGNNGNPCMIFRPYGNLTNFNQLFCGEQVTMTDYDCEWDEWSDYDCDCDCSDGSHINNAGDCHNFSGGGDSECFAPCNTYCKNQNPGIPYSGRTAGTGRTLHSVKPKVRRRRR